ncbi:MAG: MoaD/ThiS family protein [Desulfomonile sp.]|nr:MoaD/ThiS family protein [Desulfomonile sp.]
MRITVKPAGIIKRFFTEQEMDVPPGVTSRALISRLQIPPELKMISLVNGKTRKLDDPLEEGDEVRLVTLLTGG